MKLKCLRTIKVPHPASLNPLEQAHQKWNEWSRWTVTQEVFELTTEKEVDAFLQIADNNKV